MKAIVANILALWRQKTAEAEENHVLLSKHSRCSNLYYKQPPPEQRTDL